MASERKADSAVRRVVPEASQAGCAPPEGPSTLTPRRVLWLPGPRPATRRSARPWGEARSTEPQPQSPRPRSLWAPAGLALRRESFSVGWDEWPTATEYTVHTVQPHSAREMTDKVMGGRHHYPAAWGRKLQLPTPWLVLLSHRMAATRARLVRGFSPATYIQGH